MAPSSSKGIAPIDEVQEVFDNDKEAANKTVTSESPPAPNEEKQLIITGLNPEEYDGCETNEATGSLLSMISELKKQIQADRVDLIKEKLGRNAQQLQSNISTLLYESGNVGCTTDENGLRNMLSYRIQNPLCKLSAYAHGSGDKDGINNQEVPPPATIKLPCVEKIPPYITWIFLDKNQRMPEDQSVAGRRQIYYDKCGGETLICSDSDGEVSEPEELKHDFSEGEDTMLCKVLQEHGQTQEVLDVLSQFIGVASSEIQDRYYILMKKSQQIAAESFGENPYENENFLKNNLGVALDSFDSLFCRRCLVFDCRLHGCSQNLVAPREKQPWPSELGENEKPCSDKCYLLSRKQVEDACGSETTSGDKYNDKRTIGNSSETTTALEGFDGDVNEVTTTVPSDEIAGDHKNRKVEGLLSGNVWRPIEKDLYLKGIEIFGKNSCLITRNLLSGLKTCMEVYTFMFKDGDSMENFAAFPNSGQEDGTVANNHKGQEIPSRSRFCRKRGRARKLKYTWKSSGHPSSRKRMADGKQKLLKLYTPCGCESMCKKQCPCVDDGTCCEKYCGCSKSCKNRFRGCHCAKSQCRSRQCPCFAASRECDPDVCRNCWVSCGDGTLGQPPSRGDGYQCGNMKLLLKQQQRILLAKSSIIGWGAFIKNPVNKNDYLGEYTGEIISHKEANRRGKLYDRADSSFLFDLDEQYVLDACRKGDKLKFANHSFTPNCYAKVMTVAGDHRVGIFAKEHLEASEELFYNYFYGPNEAPPWAKTPESSKKDDTPAPSHGRARKKPSNI